VCRKFRDGESDMGATGQTWTIVLAAGEGRRLQELTTPASGIPIPKQFCSLRGGPSLLQEALRRAERICDRERICAVVADEHRQWWEPAVSRLPRENAIVQPRNRGTGNGILLPLLHILERDPEARIVLLPSDHHVRDERTLGRALAQAVARLAARPSRTILLGIEPEEADAGLGYIVPGRSDGFGLRTVSQFVEKPPTTQARALIADGALWNVFIVAARAQVLLGLFRDRYPGVAARMRLAVARDAGNPGAPGAARQLYESLPEIDFSRHIVEGAESALSVLTVPRCGWSDLGTPAHVARTLENMRESGALTDGALFSPGCAQLNLAAQRARLTAA
jgi:mannose-1-phosphate guanylyltransferase